MKASRILGSLVAVGAVLATHDSVAQPEIPDVLEPWRDWVLHGEEYRACPVLSGAMPGRSEAHLCAWPGELTLTVVDSGAEFSQPWQVLVEDWVPLPGDAEHWPAGVRVDGVPAPVVERNGRPAVRVAAGDRGVSGALAWARRPASLAVPAETALVSLRIDGELLPRPDIDTGALWLGLRPEAVVEDDRLTVAVYRLLADGVPIRAITEIQLDVAGQGREIELAGALLPGFVAERLDAALPAQLDADGTLRVQVRPGDWRLRVISHAAEFASALPLPAATAPWPAEEIWSFEADTRLRIAVLEGAPAVDSIASGVPNDWRGHPSYRVAAGQTLELLERSRNDADEPNRLTLARNLWLDFAGRGYTARDAVRGQMHSGWRLDMGSPYLMTMAALGADDAAPRNNLLITAAGAPGVQGVELRDVNLDLATTARLEALGSAPVTGYREAFDTVRTTVHLPPGYRLMAAPGADAVFGAWLNDWRLLDLFLALIVAAATWRLLGTGPGILAAVTMVLVFHEPAAPRWAWLNLLVALGLFQAAPEGRLRRFAKGYRNVSLAALTLLLIPFAVTQLKTVVFPQLERPRLERGAARAATDTRRVDELLSRVQQAEDRAEVPQSVDAFGIAPERLEEAVTLPEPEAAPPSLPRYLPGALVQTGPGLPDWAWTRAHLQWTSPVEPEQSFRLVIFGPWRVAAWRLASVLSAFALLWFLARPAVRLPPGLLRGSTGTAALVLAAMLAPEPGHAQASGEFPSPALLEELKNRLTEPAPCHPRCAELTRATARVAGQRLTIELEFANQAPVAVPLPGTVRGWRPETISVDGVGASYLLFDPAGLYRLSLPSGVHAVRLGGLLPAANSVSIPFPLQPRAFSVDAPGWDVAGVTEGRLLSGALELVRQEQDGAGEELGATEIPPYVRITRRIDFGLEWVTLTYLERIAPREAAFTLEVELLPGEAVITPGIEVAEGIAAVAFAAGQDVALWESRLPTAASLTLTAPADTPWSEHWQFRIGPLWHAEFAGIPRVPSESAESWLEYLPRPGESLTATLTRPEPSGGDTIAIDSVDYVADIGQRLAQSRMSFVYRSTRGTQHVVTLPSGSELDSVDIDGRSVALQLDGAALELPVTPGEHRIDVAWRNARDIGLLSRLDGVDLGAGASNLRTSIRLPESRWVLFSFGPSLGSAILYWSELLVFGLAALALGRLAWSPLRTHEWFLLGLGLSTFAWSTLLLFVVWAFVMSWRGRSELELGDHWFNGLQVALGLLTVAALASLIGAIPTGLLGEPDMQIASPVGFGLLSWFEDRSAGVTPSAGVISVSLWFYRAAMLAWALWLSFALLRWLPWAWTSYNHGGLWRGRIRVGA